MLSGSNSNRDKQGCLYIVSTPIGNLEDITIRALKILREIDMIAAENMERTKILLRHYDINKEVITYRRENQIRMTPKIIAKLKSGYNIALVSDAGTPGISDPGAYLVSKAMDEGIRVIPIPGPSAITAAISVSGISGQGFIFIGFLPNSSNKRRKELELLRSEKLPIVLFEAPHRLIDTLKDIKDIFGNRKIVLLKELTKLYEEIKRGQVDEILKDLAEIKIKGEYVIIISGEERRDSDDITKEILLKIDRLISNGLSTKDVAKIISEEDKISYRKIYKKCLERKKIIYGNCEEVYDKK